MDTLTAHEAAAAAPDGRSSPHERRVRLACAVIQEHSDLDDPAAEALARHVLYALDHVPEKMR